MCPTHASAESLPFPWLQRRGLVLHLHSLTAESESLRAGQSRSSVTCGLRDPCKSHKGPDPLSDAVARQWGKTYSCYSNRQTVISPPDSVLRLTSTADVRFLSDATHCPTVTSKSVFRTTIPDSGSRLEHSLLPKASSSSLSYFTPFRRLFKYICIFESLSIILLAKKLITPLLENL